MKKIMMTRLSVCSLEVSCNEMIDTPMLLVVGLMSERKSRNEPCMHALLPEIWPFSCFGVIKRTNFT